MQKIINILKSEALAFFIAAVWAYFLLGASWWLFLVFLLVPDVFMVGYVRNSKFGALVYNVGHTYVTPALLFCVFLVTHQFVLVPISIIWIAHISMDRVLGFGLKLDSGFKDTHLGRIGKGA